MDGPRDFTKKSKSERERQIPYDITYTWNLKYDTNQHIYEKKINPPIYREETCDCQEEGRLREGRIGSFGLEANYYM